MEDDKKPRVVVVTGASAGVGRAVVRRFATEQPGVRIALLARGRDGLEAAAREVDDLGGRAVVLPIDVADPDQVEAAAASAEAELGHIDVWINNAMTSVFSRFADMTPAEFRRVTEVTYLGYVYGTMAALRRMRPRDHGTIVQVGSVLAYRSIPLQSAYCGAKHAIQGFSESVRTELMHDGSRVRLAMVQLPAVNTPQFEWVKSRLPRKPQPVPPIYQPEVAARAVYWAARHDRREFTVGFMATMILWLNKAFPGLGDRYLARTGYDGQQTDSPADPDRPNNLWRAVPGDHGAHGEFDERSHASSPHLWANTHRGWLALTAGALAGAGWWLARD